MGLNLHSMACDASGFVYIADFSQIKKILADLTVVAFVGSTAVGFANGGGTATNFNQIHSLAFADDGYLFVVDAGTNPVRFVSPTANTSELVSLTTSTLPAAARAIAISGDRATIFLAGHHFVNSYSSNASTLGGSGGGSSSTTTTAAPSTSTTGAPTTTTGSPVTSGDASTAVPCTPPHCIASSAGALSAVATLAMAVAVFVA
jgi:hypothetical protein